MAWNGFSAHRIAGAAIVLALHVLLIALLLRATFATRPSAALRETILLLPPLPKLDARPVARHAPLPAPDIRIPGAPTITVPQMPPTGVRVPEGLGLSLFGCRPETLDSLTPEQRALCAQRSTGPDDSVDFADHTNRSRDAALWTRDRARKNAPLLLPCASNAGVGVGLGTLACLADGLINGFDPRKQSSYGDTPGEQAHVPNNGDPHPSYTDPDH